MIKFYKSGKINSVKNLERKLTIGEFRVLDILTKGLSNREITIELDLELGTIRIYLSNIPRWVSSRTQAVITAKKYVL